MTTPLSLADTPAWMDQAACRRGVDPELFFTTADDGQREAIAVCTSCAVRDHCLAHALEHGERDGVWGGRTQADLAELRRQLTLRANRAR